MLETLDYRLEAQDPETGAGPTGLTITARRNSWGPNYLRFALRLQDDFDGNATYDAAARIVFTELNSLGAEWTWDGQIGVNPHIGTEVYLPFSLQQRWFVAPHALFQVRNVPEVVDEERVGELRVRSLRFGAGSWPRHQQFRGDCALGSNARPAAPSSGFARRASRVSPSIPRNTSCATASTRWTACHFRGAATRWDWSGAASWATCPRTNASDALRFDFRTVHSWGRNTGIFWTTAGTLLDPRLTDARNFFPLGGFLNLSGLPADTLSGPQLGIVRLIYMRKLGNGGEGFLNLPLYAGASFETGNTWQIAQRHGLRIRAQGLQRVHGRGHVRRAGVFRGGLRHAGQQRAVSVGRAWLLSSAGKGAAAARTLDHGILTHLAIGLKHLLVDAAYIRVGA